jgi:hypothetical protein
MHEHKNKAINTNVKAIYFILLPSILLFLKFIIWSIISQNILKLGGKDGASREQKKGASYAKAQHVLANLFAKVRKKEEYLLPLYPIINKS